MQYSREEKLPGLRAKDALVLRQECVIYLRTSMCLEMGELGGGGTVGDIQEGGTRDGLALLPTYIIVKTCDFPLTKLGAMEGLE